MLPELTAERFLSLHTQTAQPKALTFADLKRDYGLSKESTRKLIASGAFKARRITDDSPKSKWLISAESVNAWLNGETPLADLDREPEIAPRIAEAAPATYTPIPLASLPYMDQDERRDIEARWKSGELTPTTIGGKPVLVPTPTEAQR